MRKSRSFLRSLVGIIKVNKYNKGKVVIRLDFAVPFPVRLDGLLARELQLSRSRLRQLRRDGGLTLDGAPAPKQLDRAGALIMDFTRPPCCFAR